MARNIEQGKAVKLMKLLDMIEGNCVIDAITSMLKVNLVNRRFMIPKNYKFTKENIQESYHLFAGIVVRDISQKPL